MAQIAVSGLKNAHIYYASPLLHVQTYNYMYRPALGLVLRTCLVLAAPIWPLAVVQVDLASPCLC